MHSVKYVHTISEAGRFLPSASQWNSTEIDFNLAPQSSNSYGSLPSRYSKSFDYDLVITDKAYFKRFLYISALAALLIPALVLLIHFLPHKHHPHSPTKNLTLAVNQALTFFDAQKSGNYPNYSPVKFRGNSGMQDGKVSNLNADLVGGFYDSGNNIKFSFPTAYAVTILSWSVGSTGNDTKVSNDINCWQRPEDMSYVRPVSVCDSTASDLAGEIIAALSAASIVFKDEIMYSGELIKAAGKLYEVTSREDPGRKQGTYTKVDACGGEARDYYNSTSFIDELVWGGTWLFFATGNNSYLAYATERFKAAEDEETESEKGIFYWNNKLTATAVLLTRLRFFRDLGYPYEGALRSSSSRTEILMCSYLSDHIFNKTQGGLILLRPGSGGALEFAATASFLSKLYSDYLDLLRRSGGSCGNDGFSLQMLRRFSISQVKYNRLCVHYILGDNPMKMSYMVGFGDKYPYQVHHRSASIPWDDGQHYTCAEGDRWLYSKEPNPNLLVGAMVAGPDIFDNFSDERDKLWFTEPSIASNAGLVAALIALHDPPRKSSNSASLNLGIDQTGIFDKIHSTPSNP
ncbi:Endoglucanase 10 [Citrus sinensis]|uniref:Endoglucanase 10 n=1 Tax=Citrus sinensis TaxID=2711 RepID=A0ACB8KST1_CITSI|nr:Endoglucanase 10 [Citrus sinensis]